MTFQNVVKSGLTFNKEELVNVANNEDDTMPAMVMILLSAILAGVIAMITGVGSGLGSLGGESFEGIGILVIEMVVSLFTNLVFGVILSFVLKGFGGQSGTMQVVRMVGATAIWGILGTLLSFVSPTLSLLGFVGFIALIFGVSAYSGKGMFAVFIAVLISYVIIFLLMFALMLFVFTALFAGFLL